MPKRNRGTRPQIKPNANNAKKSGSDSKPESRKIGTKEYYQQQIIDKGKSPWEIKVPGKGNLYDVLCTENSEDLLDFLSESLVRKIIQEFIPVLKKGGNIGKISFLHELIERHCEGRVNKNKLITICLEDIIREHKIIDNKVREQFNPCEGEELRLCLGDMSQQCDRFNINVIRLASDLTVTIYHEGILKDDPRITCLDKLLERSFTKAKIEEILNRETLEEKIDEEDVVTDGTETEIARENGYHDIDDLNQDQNAQDQNAEQLGDGTREMIDEGRFATTPPAPTLPVPPTPELPEGGQVGAGLRPAPQLPEETVQIGTEIVPLVPLPLVGDAALLNFGC